MAQIIANCSNCNGTGSWTCPFDGLATDCPCRDYPADPCVSLQRVRDIVTNGIRSWDGYRSDYGLGKLAAYKKILAALDE